MNRSKGRAIVLVVIATALALAIGLSLLPRLSTGPAEAPASVASAPEGAASPGEPEALVQTVNGITVSAANFRRVGNRVQADVCLVRPDDGDWLIHRPGLRYAVGGAEAEISDFSGIPIEVKSPPVNGQFGYRCDPLSFDVPAEAEPSTVTLAIRTIGALPRESEVCTTYLAKVQQALDARGAGIRVACDRNEWGDNLVVTGKPDSMSQGEAESIVLSGEFYAVDGPWLFTLSLQPDGSCRCS